MKKYQLIAKAIRVINSCKTRKQLMVADKYKDLVEKKTGRSDEIKIALLEKAREHPPG